MDFLFQSKKILSKCLFVPVESIHHNSTLEELKPGMDSITFVSIMAEVEFFTEKKVPVAEWLELETTSDLAKILENNYKN